MISSDECAQYIKITIPSSKMASLESNKKLKTAFLILEGAL